MGRRLGESRQAFPDGVFLWLVGTQRLHTHYGTLLANRACAERRSLCPLVPVLARSIAGLSLHILYKGHCSTQY